jgi:hypothetical protein
MRSSSTALDRAARPVPGAHFSELAALAKIAVVKGVQSAQRNRRATHPTTRLFKRACVLVCTTASLREQTDKKVASESRGRNSKGMRV